MLVEGSLAVMTALLSSAGIAEYALHRRRLGKIRHRIHVNGTRGKSSVARLIAAGLRAGDICTCAKTTGTLARFIGPDGSEYPVFRPARTNIIEQVRIIKAAVANQSEALVIECMALQPYLQWLSEARLVRATHAVITNARADHLDVMGPGEEDVARALCGMVPAGGKLYTAEQRHLKILEQAAVDRGATLIPVSQEDVDAIAEADLAGFRYIEHAENLAISLRVCADLGVERQVALEGMWAAPKDPGVMEDYLLDFFGRRLVFVNAFAANDPESTERLWHMAGERYPEIAHRLIVVNCRADRVDRSLQLGAALPRWPGISRVVLMGTGTHVFARAAVHAGLDPASIAHAGGSSVEQIFEAIVEVSGREALIMGVGNIGGQGMDLARYFKNRRTLEAAS